MNRVIPVCCALIFEENKILAVRRSKDMPLAGFWEFPGGKIEKGEDERKALVREIHEELGIQIVILRQLPTVDHSYEAGKMIRLIPFVAKVLEGEISLLEHDELRWLRENELFEVNWAAADIPIVGYIQKTWSDLFPINL